MPRRRAPVIHRHPFGDRAWPKDAPAPSGPSPWAETEAWLATLAEAGASVTGNAGVWQVEWASGLVVTVSAEKDTAIREALAILWGPRAAR